MIEEEEKQPRQPKTTGIKFFDRLRPEDRKLAIANTKRYWNSLTPQERTEHMSELYDIVRQKMIQSHGVLTHEQAIRDFLKNDFPQSLEVGAQEMEQGGYLDAARDIRQRRWCVDTFALEIIDSESEPRGVLEGEE
jgi:hypothetical protein